MSIDHYKILRNQKELMRLNSRVKILLLIQVGLFIATIAAGTYFAAGVLRLLGGV